MNRKFAWVGAGMALAVVAAGLTGCSDGGGSSTGSADAKKITWLDSYTDGQGDASMKSRIKEYEAAHPGVKITRTTVPQGQLVTQLTQDVSTGAAPDIVFFDSPFNQQLADGGLIADLSSHTKGWATKKQYFPGAWESTQYKGGTYSIPLYSDAPGVYSNMDMLNAAGIDKPPATWSELKDDAKKLTSGSTSGLCFGTAPFEAASYLFLPYIWQTGGDLKSIDKSAVPGLELFKQMKDDGSIPPDALSWTWQDSMTAFTNKTCAMVYGGPWNAGDVAKLPFKTEASVPPQKDDGTEATVLGGYNIGSGEGANTAAAWKVIDWFTSKKVLGKQLQETTQLPNRKDLADLPFITESAYLPVFVKSVAIGKPRSYGANWPKMSQQIQTMLQSVLAGKATPKEAAKNAEGVIEPLLSK